MAPFRSPFLECSLSQRETLTGQLHASKARCRLRDWCLYLIPTYPPAIYLRADLRMIGAAAQTRKGSEARIARWRGHCAGLKISSSFNGLSVSLRRRPRRGPIHHGRGLGSRRRRDGAPHTMPVGSEGIGRSPFNRSPMVATPRRPRPIGRGYARGIRNNGTLRTEGSCVR